MDSPINLGFEENEELLVVLKKKIKLKIGMIQVLQTYGADMTLTYIASLLMVRKIGFMWIS